MRRIAKSPDRNTFQMERYIKRREEEGKLPSPEYLELFKTFSQRKTEQEADPEWQQDNLEYDLRSNQWICDKVKASDAYAQNLYAAMCNQDWQRLDVMPILRDQRWSCSWRHAGGIVADMCESGDYIDWYCSGIGGGDEPDVYDGAPDLARKNYVPEGTVTEEIEADLKRLGWKPVEEVE